MSYSRSITFEQGSAGFNSLVPRIVRIVTNAPLSVVTSAGWIQQPPSNNVEALQPTDKVEVAYAQGTSSAATAFFNVSIVNHVVTLSLAESDVILPVTDGDFANFNGTSGAIYDAGFSPTDATKTKVAMLNSVPVVVNHVATFSATTGTIQDSGVLLSALQLAANIKAAAISWAGGATSHAFTITGLTTASIVIPAIQAQTTGTVYIESYTVTDNTLTVTFSADPGAMVLQYAAFIAPQ